MTVVKRKRKQSRFEVIHHFYQLRKEMTDLLLRDFGYSVKKADFHLKKMFGGRDIDELNENEKHHYQMRQKRHYAFEEWFIYDRRQVIMECFREIQENISLANSTYPTNYVELCERRLRQDRAIGHCHRLLQELQFTIEALPVDVNVYLRFAEKIDRQIDLLKGWRKSDNRFKQALPDTATNFANVNSNGNANNDNASNSNGVRPDFDPITLRRLTVLSGEKGGGVYP